jgi:hypothetical protein
MLLVAAAAVALAWPRLRPRPWPWPVPVPSRWLSVTAVGGTEAGRGFIDLSAHAAVNPGHRDATLWYSVTISAEGPDGRTRRIRGRSLGGVLPDGTGSVGVYTRAPKGVATGAHLAGFRVPRDFRPGRYRVLVQVWEDTPEADAAGNLLAPAHPVIVHQEWVTVE